MKETILFASILLAISAIIVMAGEEVSNNGDNATHNDRHKRAITPLCSNDGKDTGCQKHCINSYNKDGACKKNECYCKSGQPYYIV